MSLEIFFRHVIARFKAGEHTTKELLNWFSRDGSDGSEDSGGRSYSHRLLSEVSAENTKLITWMFSFAADTTEGDIFSFLMSRDLAGNTMGHVVCGQDFCQKHNMIDSGLFRAFLRCMDKLSTSLCRPDFVAAKNQLGLNLDDVIRENRVDIVKQAYYRFQAPVDGVSGLSFIHSNQSPFMYRSPPLAIAIPTQSDKGHHRHRSPSISRVRYKMMNNRFFDPNTISTDLSCSNESDVPAPPTSLKKPPSDRKRLSKNALPTEHHGAENEQFTPI